MRSIVCVWGYVVYGLEVTSFVKFSFSVEVSFLDFWEVEFSIGLGFYFLIRIIFKTLGDN